MAAIRTAEVTWNGSLARGRGHDRLRHERRVRRPARHVGVAHRGRRRPDEPRGARRRRPRLVLRDGLLGRARPATARRRPRSRSPPPSPSTSWRAGWKVVSSALTVRGTVPGLDAATFAQLAEAAKDGCPICRRAEGQRRAVGRGHARGLTRGLAAGRGLSAGAPWPGLRRRRPRRRPGAAYPAIARIRRGFSTVIRLDLRLPHPGRPEPRQERLLEVRVAVPLVVAQLLLWQTSCDSRTRSTWPPRQQLQEQRDQPRLAHPLLRA